MRRLGPEGAIAASPGAQGTAPRRVPSQPPGVRFPTRSWPRGEWPSTADRAAVDDAVDVALNDGGDARVREIVVVKGGELVYERYSPNREDGRDKAMHGFSMAKSVTSALVGTLVKDDRLDVDARHRCASGAVRAIRATRSPSTTCCA